MTPLSCIVLQEGIQMPYPPYDEMMFRKMLEIQRQMDLFYEPMAAGAALRNQQQIEEYLRSVDPLYSYEDLIGPRLDELLSIAGFPNDFFTLKDQLFQSLDSTSRMQSELDYLKRSAFFDDILAKQIELHHVEEQLPTYIDLIEEPTERIRSVMASAEAAARIWHPPEAFGGLTLALVKDYQSYVDYQFKLSRKDSDEIAGRRIEVTDLCGDLFEAINASLEIGAIVESRRKERLEAEEAAPIGKSNLYSHVNQHLGFVYTRRFKGNVEIPFNRSNPPRSAYLGYSIVQRVYRINVLCEKIGRGPVFKPTSKTMFACGVIPSHIATTEESFNYLIDHLYFLIYEGSGSAKRLTTVTSDEDLQALWTLKHLRLAARHDVDHGHQAEIEAKQSKIREAFNSLGGKAMPSKPKDWQATQVKLYDKIDSMLTVVIECLENHIDNEDG
jgi:hypothetical protein